MLTVFSVLFFVFQISYYCSSILFPSSKYFIPFLFLYYCNCLTAAEMVWCWSNHVKHFVLKSAVHWKKGDWSPARFIKLYLVYFTKGFYVLKWNVIALCGLHIKCRKCEQTYLAHVGIKLVNQVNVLVLIFSRDIHARVQMHFGKKKE